MTVIKGILELLFPPKCILCGAILEKGELDLCKACRIDAPEYPGEKKKYSYIDSHTALWYYEGYARRSILRYKFRNRRSYAVGYGRLLAMKLQERHPDGVDILTWVPVSARRKRSRGYDQVELLADAVGQELSMKPEPLLKKVRHNRAQSGIRGDAQRRANVLGAYELTDPAAVAGKTILLLDDVITTGATAGECARVLLTAGAEKIHFGAIAVAPSSKK